MKARVSLRIRAGARRTELMGRYADGWKLHVAAPPVDGRANRAIIRFLAGLAQVPVSSVKIVAGLTSATKVAEIEGADPEQLERAILDFHGPRENSASTAAPES